MPTLVCWHQGTDLPEIAEATVCTVHIQERSYSIDEASRRNQLSLWNSRSKTIKPFGLNTGNHQQCQVMQLCIDMIYHPCAGYLFFISRSALSRKTARVYPHFVGLTFADNCEEEVRSTDWHIGWRGPLLESFYLHSSPGVVQESQKFNGHQYKARLGSVLVQFIARYLRQAPLVGSFSIDYGDGSENVTFKMNSRCFKLCRVYSKEPRESAKCGRISLKMTLWPPLLS